MHNFYQAGHDVKVGSGHKVINIGYYDVANVVLDDLTISKIYNDYNIKIMKVLFINTVKAIKIQLI